MYQQTNVTDLNELIMNGMSDVDDGVCDEDVGRDES